MCICINYYYFPPYRVSWASPHIANAEPRPRETWSQVHVTFSTPFLDLFITEEFLEEIFSAFGTVADVTVKRHNRNTTIPPSHSGYAFVYYYELPPAARAVQRFTEMAEINNVRLMCNLPHVIRDKHEKPHYARTEPRGIPHMSAGPRGAPRPMGYGKPPSGHYNNYPPDSFPPRDPYFRGPGRGPSMYDIPPSRGEYSGEYEFANARKFAPPRYGGEVDVGYSSRSSEYANQMLFAGERHRPDMHPSAWPSHSSGHLSREALLTSQNSGELSLSSWSSLSHSNSLNFASNSTPIGQQQKTFGFSDSLLSSAPPGPAASSATGMKVIPPSSAEEGVTNPSSVDHTFGLNLDTLED